MKEKLLFGAGAVIFALSAVVLAFVFTIWQTAFCATCCFGIPLAIIAMGCFKVKPYEYFLYAAGFFVSIILLLTVGNSLWLCLPLFMVILWLIICRKRKKENTIGLVMILIMQFVLSLLLMFSISIFNTIEMLEDTPYTKQTISNIEKYSQTHYLINFESSADTYQLESNKAELLKEGDTVQVKILGKQLYFLKRF